MKAKRRPLTEPEHAAQRRLNAVWNRKKAALELTQESAARWMGITQGAVGHYLNGKIPLNVEAVLAFATLLGESPVALAPEIVGRYAGAMSMQSGEGAAIEARYHAAGPDHRHLIADVAELGEADVLAVRELFSVARGSGEALADVVREQRAAYLPEADLAALRNLDHLGPDDRAAVHRVLALIGQCHPPPMEIPTSTEPKQNSTARVTGRLTNKKAIDRTG